MYYPIYGLDPTYILVIIGVILCLIAQGRMSATFNKYSQVRSRSGLTGREAAERILRANGILDVRVEHVAGNLTDHYDPRSRTLRLSDTIYNSTSVAAIGVAAHECGHAVQHQQNYVPLKLRSALVPVANLGSTLAWPMILIGLLFGRNSSSLFINLGIIFFMFAVVFQLVTLPVEFNASRRAVTAVANTGILHDEEVGMTRKVLTAAALTYVASAATAILQLLRILLLTRNNRD